MREEKLAVHFLVNLKSLSEAASYLLVQVALFVYRRVGRFIMAHNFFIKLHFNIAGCS